MVFPWLETRFSPLSRISRQYPSSNHGEGDEEGGGGSRPEEGDAARDEGHEVSWDLVPVVRSGSEVRCAGSSVWVSPHLSSVGGTMHLCEP